MFPGVRPHQTVAVVPVQYAFDRRSDRQSVAWDLVGYLLFAFDPGDLAPVQRTAVPFLASSAGIEGGAVQDHPVPLHLGNGGGELFQVGVGLVKLDGHDLWMV